jgi:hypothetical protein
MTAETGRKSRTERTAGEVANGNRFSSGVSGEGRGRRSYG